jgi:hypothetical protein
MDFTLSEEEIQDAKENPIPLITFKGKVHIHAFTYNTACNLSIPMQGKHLVSRKNGKLEDVTCTDCLKL